MYPCQRSDFSSGSVGGSTSQQSNPAQSTELQEHASPEGNPHAGRVGPSCPRQGSLLELILKEDAMHEKVLIMEEEDEPPELRLYASRASSLDPEADAVYDSTRSL